MVSLIVDDGPHHIARGVDALNDTAFAGLQRIAVGMSTYVFEIAVGIQASLAGDRILQIPSVDNGPVLRDQGSVTAGVAWVEAGVRGTRTYPGLGSLATVQLASVWSSSSRPASTPRLNKIR